MRNIGLQLVYQGSDFHGYQIQPGLRTVQACLEAALKSLLTESVATICAGRTDAGVHAYAQVVNFCTGHSLPVERFAPALNSLLPPDLRIAGAWELDPAFNARFAARARHYRYVIGKPASPLQRQVIWQCAYDLDLELLKATWLNLQGQHDFRAFCRKGSYRQNFVIPIYWTRCWQHGSLTVLEIMGQSFVYNMVRTLVGTAVDMARGRLAPDTLSQALSRGERKLVGTTAPPQGLTLYNVIYPPACRIQLIQPEIHAWPVPIGPIIQTSRLVSGQS